MTLNLVAGKVYYFGITRYTGNAGGDFVWAIDGPGRPRPRPDGFNIEIRFGTGLTASQQAIFRQAARWEQAIIGDLPNATYQGRAVDDVLIDASGVRIDGPSGILGQAGPDAFRAGSRLPIHGTMQFDSADLASLEAARRASGHDHPRDGPRPRRRHQLAARPARRGRHRDAAASPGPTPCASTAGCWAGPSTACRWRTAAARARATATGKMTSFATS